jgi:flagellar biosynthesis protein FliQ
MNQEMVMKLARDALQTTLLVSSPLLVVSLVVGIFISVAQVVTSIQDMALAFVPRIIAVFVVFLIVFPWIMSVMIAFSGQLWGHLEQFAR